MTLLELIQKHELKVGAKVKSDRGVFEILCVGIQKVFVKDDDGEFAIYGEGSWELYSEPKVPLSLDCEVEWKHQNSYQQFAGTPQEYVVPMFDLKNIDSSKKLNQFIGKRTRMVLTEIIEEE